MKVTRKALIALTLILLEGIEGEELLLVAV